MNRFVATLATMTMSLASGCMPSYQVTRSSDDRTQCLRRDEETPILWYSPEGAAENRDLENWCTNIGPPFVQARPEADFSDIAGDSITVFVWNVEVEFGWTRRFLEEEAGMSCAGPESTLTEGSPHFVLLVQEALRRSNDMPEEAVADALLPRVGGTPHPGARIDIVQLAERCGLSIFYLPGLRNGEASFAGMREDKGNAILSTLPLSGLAGIELPFESVRRVVPVATVTTHDDRKLRVASVHLITTPPPWRIVMTGNTARERQSLGLADGIARVEIAHGVESVVAGGDLNTFSKRETALRKLHGIFPDSPPPLDEPTRGPIPADHLLFRKSDFFESEADHIIPGSYHRIDNKYNSDHHPIMARIRLGR